MVKVKEAVETANEVKEPLEAKSRSWRSKNRWRLNPEAVETALKQPIVRAKSPGRPQRPLRPLETSRSSRSSRPELPRKAAGDVEVKEAVRKQQVKEAVSEQPGQRSC